MKILLNLVLASLFASSIAFAKETECTLYQEYTAYPDEVKVVFDVKKVENPEGYNAWWVEIPKQGMLKNSVVAVATYAKSTCGENDVPCYYASINVFDACKVGSEGCNTSQTGIGTGVMLMGGTTGAIDPSYVYIEATGRGTGDFINMSCVTK